MGKRHLGENFFLQLMRPLWVFLDLLSQNSKIFAKFQQNCTVLFFLGVISKFRYITHRNTCIYAIITTSNCLLLYNPMHNLNNLIKTYLFQTRAETIAFMYRMHYSCFIADCTLLWITGLQKALTTNQVDCV